MFAKYGQGVGGIDLKLLPQEVVIKCRPHVPRHIFKVLSDISKTVGWVPTATVTGVLSTLFLRIEMRKILMTLDFSEDSSSSKSSIRYWTDDARRSRKETVS